MPPGARRHDCLSAPRRTYLVIDESIQIKSNKSAQTKRGAPAHRLGQCRRSADARPLHSDPYRPAADAGTAGFVGAASAPSAGSGARTGLFVPRRVLRHGQAGWRSRWWSRPRTPSGSRPKWPRSFSRRRSEGLAAVPAQQADDHPRLRDVWRTEESGYKSMEEEFLYWRSRSGVVTVDVAIAKYAKLAQIQTGFIYDETG